MITDAQRWNHNIHYHPLILRAAGRAHRENALDVGCGEGMLARELRTVVAHVTALDLDSPSIVLAKQRPVDGVDYQLGDFMTATYPRASFDFIASVAALHHMNAAEALARMRTLLRPGGTLAIIGLARNEMPRDLPFELAAGLGNLPYKLTKTYWEHSAPMVWPPPETYASMRRIAERILPGSQSRRRLLWRYSLIWTKSAT